MESNKNSGEAIILKVVDMMMTPGSGWVYLDGCELIQLYVSLLHWYESQ